MNVRIAFALLAAAACGSWVFAQGCGGDDASQQDATDDGTTGNDTGATQDSAVSDAAAGGDTSTNDAGADASGNDGSSSGLSYRCGLGPDAGMVSDCAQCQGSPLPCVFCAVADASVVEGRCAPEPFGCQVQGNTGFASCPCAGGEAGACPESFQVCRKLGNSDTCHTCGDSPADDGLACKGGGTCAADGGCN